MSRSIVPALWTLLTLVSPARELHVSVDGDDASAGHSSRPVKTIMAAARLAQPGDTIVVHGGTYRERVTPPRGGESETRRIVYEAARGETVIIKGSEVIRDWKPFLPGVWKATVAQFVLWRVQPVPRPDRRRLVR
jgi:alpha-N-arabinofuranosidase